MAPVKALAGIFKHLSSHPARNGIQEVVGSIPISSTSEIRRLRYTTPPLFFIHAARVMNA